MFIIDPLALDDMTPLGDVLSNERVEIILHSGDHDIRSLDRDWGFRVTSLFDTSIAAAFTGMDRLGLGTVLESSLGVSITKDKKLQRSDWTIRPLKSKYLDYAADDVRHLLRLTDNLKSELSRSAGWAGSPRNPSASPPSGMNRPTPKPPSSESRDPAD